MIRMIFIMNWKAKNLLHTTFSRKMKEFRKQHVMESKFHSFWTKSKCRLKNFVAALNQFSQFVQCVQIVGARVFEVMFSVTTVCLVQGRSHFPFLLHQCSGGHRNHHHHDCTQCLSLSPFHKPLPPGPDPIGEKTAPDFWLLTLLDFEVTLVLDSMQVGNHLSQVTLRYKRSLYFSLA